METNKKIFFQTILLFTAVISFMFVFNVRNADAATKEKETVIYLTRHGQTTANVMKVWQGWSDYPLTENGIEGAKQLGYGLKGIEFKSAYTGDLNRQLFTGQYALKYSGNKETKIKQSSNLREVNFGSFEGVYVEEYTQKISNMFGYQNFDELQKKEGTKWLEKLEDGYHQLDQQNIRNTSLSESDRAEDAKTVRDRMTKEIRKIAENTQKKGGGNVLIVSSGIAIGNFLETDKNIENESVTKLIYKNKKFIVDGEIGSTKYIDKGEKIMSKLNK